MFETCMVAILVAAMCALIREYGGFDALLAWIHRIFRGKRGGQLGMGLLVGAMDIATANNTVAIVMANPIAKEMAQEYGITPRKAARSWIPFPVFSRASSHTVPRCWWPFPPVQPSLRHQRLDIIPLLFYPFLLCLSSLLFILFDKK